MEEWVRDDVWEREEAEEAEQKEEEKCEVLAGEMARDEQSVT